MARHFLCFDSSISVGPSSEDQIDRYNLPTRPTKKSDSRAKGFQGESVEVDPLKAKDLRAIVNEKITEHMNPIALDNTWAAEKSDRKILDKLLRTYTVG